MTAAQGAGGVGNFLDAGVYAAVVREAAVQERAEVDEGLHETDSAAAVEHEVRGI